MREKDDKIKTVEELLEAGLIQVANKEEDLKVKPLILSFYGEIHFAQELLICMFEHS